MKTEIAIIGAGPAGIGAGRRCLELSLPSWRIFEATGGVGGLSSSRVDRQGFTWDLGGHVIFSSDTVFNAAVEEALGENALEHTRKSFIRLGKRFVPFPLQNNIHRLPQPAMRECLEGLADALSRADGSGPNGPRNFEEWIHHRLGSGIAKHFMLPYNRKLWAYPLDTMGFGWIEGRVALPSIERIKSAVYKDSDDNSWGPNAKFRFPLKGGTGRLFVRMAHSLLSRTDLHHAVMRVDERRKRIHFTNGKSAQYSRLISTAPLTVLVKKLLAHPPRRVLLAAGQLRSNSGWMVGIGINRRIDANRSWVYFPEENVPFYRVTQFSNYSPFNVPVPGKQTSFMCEISSGPRMRRNGITVIEETLRGLVDSGIIRPSDRKRVASAWKIRLPFLYPVPTIGREAAQGVIEEYLLKHGIQSVGRFGGWRYEKGNMDHSFRAGYEAAGA